MNYNLIYNQLIERAVFRQINGYVERHHIIPKCIGGADNQDNIVLLTPEEHYVAHQLLVKIYPTNEKLIYAASMMCVSNISNNKNTVRRRNKLYGWLKRKISELAHKRIGSKNGSYGKYWYHDPITGINGKFIPGTQPTDWQKGRIQCRKCIICTAPSTGKQARYCKNCRPRHCGKYWYHDPITGLNGKFIPGTQPNSWHTGQVKCRKCILCNTPSASKQSKYCKNCCSMKRKNKKTKVKQTSIVRQPKTKTNFTNEEKIAALKENNGNIRRALFSLGLNDSGTNYKMMSYLKSLL